jgi:hypothetical protein
MTNSNNYITINNKNAHKAGTFLNSDMIIILADIILLALFILFVWRRRSLKSFDWLTLITICLGIALLTIVIFRVSSGSIVQSPVLQAILIIIPTLLLVLFLLFLTRVLTVEGVKSRFHMDERITLINVKSARNALVAIYLSSLIDLMIYPDMTRGLLLGILGFSLLVYLASLIIYYYRRS